MKCGSHLPMLRSQIAFISEFAIRLFSFPFLGWDGWQKNYKYKIAKVEIIHPYLQCIFWSNQTLLSEQRWLLCWVVVPIPDR